MEMTIAQKRALAVASARLRLQNGSGSPQETQPAVKGDTGIDLLKGIGTGLAEGAIGAVSFPATIGTWAGKKFTGAVDSMMGVAPEETAARQAQVETMSKGWLNPANLQENIEGVTGPFYQAKTTPGQYAQTVGQFLPSAIAGGPVKMGAKALAAVSGGIGSEAAGQSLKGSEWEPYARLGGALAGGFVPSALKRVVTPLPVSPERAGLLKTMKSEGVDITAGQASGRQGMRYLESELGGGKIAKITEKQSEQFTAAALKRAGITANRATPEVIDDAFKRLGTEFDNLASRNSIPPNAQLANDVVQVVTDYANLVPNAARAPVVHKLARDIVTAAQTGIPGDKYQALRSRLETMARGSTDPQLSTVLRGMKDSLDDAMEASLAATGSPDLGAWQNVRRQYRNIIVIEQAAAGAGEKTAEGLLSPSQLASATKSKHGRRNYVRGKGDFADLARAGEATMKPLPQSGTAPRTAARAMGTSIPALLGGMLGSKAGMGAEGLLIGGLGGAALPYALGRGLLSAPVQAYLKNQMLKQGALTPSQRAAIAAMGSAAQINNSGGR